MFRFLQTEWKPRIQGGRWGQEVDSSWEKCWGKQRQEAHCCASTRLRSIQEGRRSDPTRNAAATWGSSWNRSSDRRRGCHVKLKNQVRLTQACGGPKSSSGQPATFRPSTAKSETRSNMGKRSMPRSFAWAMSGQHLDRKKLHSSFWNHIFCWYLFSGKKANISNHHLGYFGGFEKHFLLSPCFGNILLEPDSVSGFGRGKNTDAICLFFF